MRMDLCQALTHLSSILASKYKETLFLPDYFIPLCPGTASFSATGGSSVELTKALQLDTGITYLMRDERACSRVDVQLAEALLQKWVERARVVLVTG